MSFGGPSVVAQAPPPLPDPVASPPTLASGGNKPAGSFNKIPNYGGTLLTSGEGVTSATYAGKKSLLGQ